MSHPALPKPALLRAQAEWLAPARSLLLRQAAVARRRRILDLGCGYGAVTEELVRRGGGSVIALDRDRNALRTVAATVPDALPVCAEATRLPLLPATVDLVFSQCALLWMDAPTALAEARRVLQPGGVFLALEPDYGGMMEYPPALASREIWLSALKRAGADPQIGRKLPGWLAAQGLTVRVSLFSELRPPAMERFAFLRELPLTAAEAARLASVEKADAALAGDPARVAHLPFFLIFAELPRRE